VNKCSALAEMGDHLATIDMGQKWGGCAPLGEGELGPRLTQCGQARSLPTYRVASWILYPSSHLTTTDVGRKLGGCASMGKGELGPHLTMWPRPRPTCMPSFISIHPTVWPQ